jgi:hypothetical protein
VLGVSVPQDIRDRFLDDPTRVVQLRRQRHLGRLGIEDDATVAGLLLMRYQRNAATSPRSSSIAGRNSSERSRTF